jgi:hypothetical protein
VNEQDFELIVSEPEEQNTAAMYAHRLPSTFA